MNKNDKTEIVDTIEKFYREGDSRDVTKIIVYTMTDEVSLDELLDCLDKEEIAEYLNESYSVSGYRVIKCENLLETQQIESYLRRIGKL